MKIALTKELILNSSVHVRFFTSVGVISAGGEAHTRRIQCCVEVDGCCLSSISSAEKLPSEESLPAIVIRNILPVMEVPGYVVSIPCECFQWE